MRPTYGFHFETIVVATDLTHASEPALDYARLIASKNGARVVLAHVIDPLSYANLADVPEKVLQGLNDEARQKIEQLSDELLAAGIPSHSVVRQGVVSGCCSRLRTNITRICWYWERIERKGQGRLRLGRSPSRWSGGPIARCWPYRPMPSSRIWIMHLSAGISWFPYNAPPHL